MKTKIDESEVGKKELLEILEIAQNTIKAIIFSGKKNGYGLKTLQNPGWVIGSAIEMGLGKIYSDNLRTVQKTNNIKEKFGKI